MAVAGRTFAGDARGESFAEFVLALLVALQHFAGALDDAARQAGQTRDFDAVTLVRAAGLDATKKNNLARGLFDGNVDVLHAGKQIGEFREFVIMGGEKRACASVLLEMLDDSPGDGEAIERGSAAAHLVKQDKAGRSGVIKNGGDFAHFDKKRGAAAREIVARANARKYAVGDGKLGLARGNERAHLRHENDERRLAQIGGLAAHVRAGNQKQLQAPRLEAKIVG